jgi:hypothetical protein
VVTPAMCPALRLRLYPLQFEADASGNIPRFRKQWQFEVAGEEVGAESRGTRGTGPHVTFMLDTPAGAWSDRAGRTAEFQIQRRSMARPRETPVACVKLQLTPAVDLAVQDRFALTDEIKVRRVWLNLAGVCMMGCVRAAQVPQLVIDLRDGAVEIQPPRPHRQSLERTQVRLLHAATLADELKTANPRKFTKHYNFARYSLVRKIDTAVCHHMRAPCRPPRSTV